MLSPSHMIIVFTCNIRSLCVNILYRLFLMTLATALRSKTVFQVAGAYGIENDGTIDEKQVSLFYRVA